MARSDAAVPTEQAPFVLSLRYVGGIFVLMTLALLPVMAFLILTEREVSQYSTLTFESHVRKALDERASGRAVRICTGALRIGISRSDYWGKAYLLRAKAHAGEQNSGKALDDLETSARLWTEAPYNATEDDHAEIAAFGTKFARQLLDAGNAAGARRAISAAGMGSGNPVEYLHQQWAAWPAATRQALWPEGPCITAEGYGGADLPEFKPASDDQPRKLIGTRVEPSAGREGTPCAFLDLAAGSTGESVYTIAANIPLSEKPFALRVAVKQDPPGPAKVFLSYWFDSARRSAATTDTTSIDLGNGWNLFEIKRNFFEERTAFAKKEGYDPVGGVISRIGLSFPQGPAMRCWVDKIELFIPQAGAQPG